MGFRREESAVGAAFFLSGAAALVYQVAWQRILALHSGVGIYSVALIVAAFLAGLGLGSHLGGSWSARVSPAAALRTFAAVEIGIGVFGAASPWLYYDWLYARAGWLYTPAWRAGLLHLAGLIVPTTLMGMSLPFLVRGRVLDVPSAGRVIGALYGINLLGAALGAGLTPWVLVREWGLRGALLVAAAANVAAGLIALAASRPGSEVPAAPASPPPALEEPSRGLAFWALLYALGGFCALSLEIAWFRLLDVALKATAYTFGTLLAVYLLGMAAGTLAGTRLVSQIRRPLAAFLLTQAALLAWAGLALLALVHLPPETAGFRALYEYWSAPRPFNLGASGDWAGLLRLYVLFPLLLYGLPTALMGFSFTVLQRAVQDDPRTSGRKVGLLQAANIAGCVAGSLLTGLVLLDRIGLSGACRLVVACGLVFAGLGLALTRRAVFAAAAAVLLAVVLLLPGQQALWLRVHGTADPASMVDEDATGMAALIPAGERWTLWVNGRTNSSLPFGGMHTLLGAAPASIHPSPERVAVIGLGSGDTAWAAACRPETRDVTVFELLAPQRRLLTRLAAQAAPPAGLVAFLADPRLRHRVADGRNALALGDARYDIIEMDALFPSSPGSGTLYSVEFFQLCARRLRPGGLMCSWSPRPRVAAGFRRAFPHVIEMRDASILIGSNDPLPLDVAAWVSRARSAPVAGYLGDNNVRKLVACLESAQPATAGPAAEGDVNRDLFPRDEFKTSDE
jgi:predicted membrane-bound spermidine synthase